MLELTIFQQYVGRAAIALGADSMFSFSESEVVDWMDNKNPPTDEELNTKIAELQKDKT